MHNNSITIAKALGIIFVVVWHSRGIHEVGVYVMFFAVPLFFFTSGMFFKQATDVKGLLAFTKKRLKGLYVPYVKWGLLFLLLHNLLFSVHVYSTEYGFEHTGTAIYTAHDFFAKGLSLFLKMYTEEPLLGAFWFIRTLFMATLFVAALTFVVGRVVSVSKWLLLVALFGLTFLASYWAVNLPLIGNADLLLFAAVFYVSGWIYHDYKDSIKATWPVVLILLAASLSGLLYYKDVVSMLSCSPSDLVGYYVLALLGILFTLTLGELIEKTRLRSVFYFIGNETLIILALHFLCFKPVSLLKIWCYGYPIDQLAEFPVIEEDNQWFWILYTLAGVSLPLLVGKASDKCVDYCRSRWMKQAEGRCLDKQTAHVE